MKLSDYPFLLRLLFIGNLVLLSLNTIYFFRISTVSIGAKEVIAALGSLFGTFIGAWLAFQFALKQRQAKKETDDYSSGNLALSTLGEMWNSLKQYQSEVIDGYRDRHDAWLNMPGTQPLILREVSLNTKDLSFLLDSDAPTFQKVLLEEHRFKLAGHVVDRRNELLLTRAWPALSAAGIRINEQRTPEEIERILGVNVVQELRVTTQAIIRNVDEDVDSSKKAFLTLRSSLIRKFPEKKFIRMDFDKKLSA